MGTKANSRIVTVTVGAKNYRVNMDEPILGRHADKDCLVEFFESIGVPYAWGAGDVRNSNEFPRGVVTPNSKGIRGYDCSGFVIAALVRLGIMDPTKVADDLHSSALVNMSLPVYELEPGDVLYYPGHVMLYIGRGMCMGATGGRSNTHGTDPNACVKVLPITYSGGLVCGCRLKQEYRS